MSDIEVPLEDALENRDLLDDDDEVDVALETEELDIEAPEANVVEQLREVEVDDDSYG